jgi:hypothetical protein
MKREMTENDICALLVRMIVLGQQAWMADHIVIQEQQNFTAG